MTVPIGLAKERQEQLVIELAVFSLERSLPLYAALGFTLERRDRASPLNTRSDQAAT